MGNTFYIRYIVNGRSRLAGSRKEKKYSMGNTRVVTTVPGAVCKVFRVART